MERISQGRKDKLECLTRKIMSDKVAETAEVPESIITAAQEANSKYGKTQIPVGLSPEGAIVSKNILSTDVGTNILTTEEKKAELEHQNVELEYQNVILENRAKVDQVTGIPNEKAFDDMLDGLQARYQRDGLSGTFITADLTGLHDANDKYGRSAGGDDYLRSVALALKGASRESDRSFRMGTAADEFVLYLPGNNSKGVVDDVLDRVDSNLNKIQADLQKKYPGISFGLSYAISNFGDGVAPTEAYFETSNKMGEAKDSKKKAGGGRVGNVGRIYIDHDQKQVSLPVPEHVG